MLGEFSNGFFSSEQGDYTQLELINSLYGGPSHYSSDSSSPLFKQNFTYLFGQLIDLFKEYFPNVPLINFDNNQDTSQFFHPLFLFKQEFMGVAGARPKQSDKHCHGAKLALEHFLFVVKNHFHDPRDADEKQKRQLELSNVLEQFKACTVGAVDALTTKRQKILSSKNFIKGCVSDYKAKSIDGYIRQYLQSHVILDLINVHNKGKFFCEKTRAQYVAIYYSHMKMILMEYLVSQKLSSYPIVYADHPMDKGFRKKFLDTHSHDFLTYLEDNWCQVDLIDYLASQVITHARLIQKGGQFLPVYNFISSIFSQEVAVQMMREVEDKKMGWLQFDENSSEFKHHVKNLLIDKKMIVKISQKQCIRLPSDLCNTLKLKSVDIPIKSLLMSTKLIVLSQEKLSVLSGLMLSSKAELLSLYEEILDDHEGRLNFICSNKTSFVYLLSLLGLNCFPLEKEGSYLDRVMKLINKIPFNEVKSSLPSDVILILQSMFVFRGDKPGFKLDSHALSVSYSCADVVEYANAFVSKFFNNDTYSSNDMVVKFLALNLLYLTASSKKNLLFRQKIIKRILKEITDGKHNDGDEQELVTGVMLIFDSCTFEHFKNLNQYVNSLMSPQFVDENYSLLVKVASDYEEYDEEEISNVTRFYRHFFIHPLSVDVAHSLFEGVGVCHDVMMKFLEKDETLSHEFLSYYMGYYRSSPRFFSTLVGMMGTCFYAVVNAQSKDVSTGAKIMCSFINDELSQGYDWSELHSHHIEHLMIWPLVSRVLSDKKIEVNDCLNNFPFNGGHASTYACDFVKLLMRIDGVCEGGKEYSIKLLDKLIIDMEKRNDANDLFKSMLDLSSLWGIEQSWVVDKLLVISRQSTYSIAEIIQMFMQHKKSNYMKNLVNIFINNLFQTRGNDNFKATCVAELFKLRPDDFFSFLTTSVPLIFSRAILLHTLPENKKSMALENMKSYIELISHKNNMDLFSAFINNINTSVLIYLLLENRGRLLKVVLSDIDKPLIGVLFQCIMSMPDKIITHVIDAWLMVLACILFSEKTMLNRQEQFDFLLDKIKFLFDFFLKSDGSIKYINSEGYVTLARNLSLLIHWIFERVKSDGARVIDVARLCNDLLCLDPMGGVIFDNDFAIDFFPLDVSMHANNSIHITMLKLNIITKYSSTDRNEYANLFKQLIKDLAVNSWDCLSYLKPCAMKKFIDSEEFSSLLENDFIKCLIRFSNMKPSLTQQSIYSMLVSSLFSYGDIKFDGILRRIQGVYDFFWIDGISGSLTKALKESNHDLCGALEQLACVKLHSNQSFFWFLVADNQWEVVSHLISRHLVGEGLIKSKPSPGAKSIMYLLAQNQQWNIIFNLYEQKEGLDEMSSLIMKKGFDVFFIERLYPYWSSLTDSQRCDLLKAHNGFQAKIMTCFVHRKPLIFSYAMLYLAFRDIFPVIKPCAFNECGQKLMGISLKDVFIDCNVHNRELHSIIQAIQLIV